MYVLGISCFYHDAAAVLVQDGRLLCASQEERFSRIKHDFSFPQRAIDFCLKRANITVEDLDLVVFYDKPFQKFDRILMSALATWPRSAVAFREATMVWLLDKLWTRDIIQERLGCSRDKIAFCRHHLAHACSAYYPSGFERAALLTVDGVGEWSCGSRGAAWDFTVDVCEEMRYPHSLGLLYSAFTAFLGFQVNEGEYKVMGMAPYGRPKFVDTIFKNLVELHEDGSFKLDMSYFAYHRSAFHSFTEKFTALFGKPRTKEESNLLDPHYADIAASIQRVTEIILVRQATYLHKKYGHENLCMAGGTALNSVANAKIFKEAGFKNIYIQPAAGDDGGALGAALWGYHNVLGGRQRFKMTHCYWGAEYSDEEIKDFLKSEGREFKEYPDDETLFNDVVSRLTHGQVVGWMQGRFEWGPRALGDRSILADPRFSQMKDIVNARIKFREPFRPFAPSVLADRVEEFFELPNAMQVDPARFMLMVVPVKSERQKDIPAITHVDGTARIQAIHRDDNPRYYDLIKSFADKTGVPVLLNTSFNLRGEAIVNTPAEAYSTFVRSDMDALVMGHIVVSRREIDERRELSKTEQEMWAHTPTQSTASASQLNSKETDPRDVAVQAAKNHRNYLALLAKQRKDSDLSPWGYTVQYALTALLFLAILEVIARLALPMPNMQMRGIYSLNDEGQVMLTPHWQGRIHTSEFDTKILLDENGQRSLNLALSSKINDYKILAIGDSFTFGCWSNLGKTWLDGIQDRTGAEVVNMGRPNAGTETAWRIASDVKELKQYRTLLHGFYTGNDMYDNLLGNDSFTVRDGGLVLTPQAEAKWSKYDCLSAHNSPVSIGWRPQLLARTYLYQIAMGFIHSDKHLITPASDKAWMLKRYTPEMERAVELTYEYLGKLKDLCRANDIDLIIAIIPSASEVYPEDMERWLAYSGHEAGLFDVNKPRQIVMQWCQENDIPTLDLRDILASSTRTYYKRDMHWNDRGHALAGLATGNFLLEQNIRENQR